MTQEEAKKWAELFTAYAEGKIIERQEKTAADSFVWVQVTRITTVVELDKYRIKPQTKIRRMTHQELADWLRDCPEEHREYKYSRNNPSNVYHEYGYTEEEENDECWESVVIRRNHGEWEFPNIEVEEYI